jgi:prophage tail gpP-like protein
VADVRLVVNGREYGGWKSVRITRSVESIAGSFDLEANDRWAGQDEPWPLAEEDECRVEIDGAVVIDGYIDRRSMALAGQQRTLSFAGRDRAAVLVDCSAVLDAYTFRKATVLDVARKVCAPFGIEVSLQDGLALPTAPAKTVINPGDSAWQALERVAQSAGVLVVSDGRGGIVITRSGTGRATALIEGQNVLGASVDYDGTARYARYVVVTQVGGTDSASGNATRIEAEATDEAVRRTDRVLLIQPEAGITAESARRRGDWEARIRAAQAETVSVVVQGWQQPDGELWPINALVEARIPAIGVNGQMLISQVEHTLSDGAGETTQLRLVRPDAFTPEPKAVVRQRAGGLWKELAGGAL